MNDEKIKEAFTKVKQDILSLHSEISLIKKEIQQIKILVLSQIKQLDRQTNKQTDNPAHNPTQIQTQTLQNPTIQHISPTQAQLKTHSSTHNFSLKAIKSQNSNISTGNEGVSTDRQTNQQTDNSTRNQGVKVRLIQEKPTNFNKLDQLDKVADFLDSLDNIKKELRQNLKKLTNQEMTVFSTIYQLEEEGFIADYSLIAKKLSLTESSIRDYCQRIIKKNLPLEKTKENNKKIMLSISQNLKKIASLSTVIQLREL